MKILVSTKRGQGGHAPNDFCYVPEGEIVKFGFECDHPQHCGCDRAMIGIESSKATTTVTVADIKGMTVEKLARDLKRSYDAGGWGKVAPKPLKEFRTDAQELVTIARQYKVGALLRA